MMSKKDTQIIEQESGGISRRQMLGGAALAAGGLALPGLANAAEVNPDNLPPNVSEWTPYLGPGVDVNPYGMPSEYEGHVVRRSVEWLTASAESSVNFTPLQDLDGIVTPNGLCFERHHGGVPDVNPTDYRLMINGLVDHELLFSLDDPEALSAGQPFPFSRMCGQWRHGMARGPAEWLPVYIWHGA